MNTEDAYRLIAQQSIEMAGTIVWERLIAEIKVYEKMSSVINWAYVDGKKIQGDGAASIHLNSQASQAVLFLRDNLLETTGQRIWGLTFTFTRDGNFNIEYDYEKPEDIDD